MGQWPQFSYPYPEILTKLSARGGNNSPMPYADAGAGVSGLMPWIRVISAYGCTSANASENGLIMQSNYPEDGFNIRYGNGSTGPNGESGICGFELDYQTPVRVTGRPTRPAPIISGLSISEIDIGKKTANFSITCYTLEHMEKVAKYFMEPGFYVLLEWGWNSRDARKVWCGNPKTGAITPCDIAQYINAGHLMNKRKQSKFDYDAMLGLTSTGGIKFGDNETYILDITVTSIGTAPQYLQSHKGPSSLSGKNISSERFNPAEIDELSKKDGVAKALFRQMFNDLNSEKQTTEVKDWETLSISKKDKDYAFLDYNEVGDDVRWADESNYINMDKEVQNTILTALKANVSIEATDDEDGSDFELPEDKPLLSEDRFIRFELACAILNADYTKKSSAADSSINTICKKNKVSSVINIDTSIICAFPHMWSLDRSILYIPNPTAPSFNIESAFTGKDANTKFIDLENLSANLTNLHPTPTAGITWTGTRRKNNEGYNNAPHAFPSQYELTEADNKWEYDDSIKSYEMDTQYWGWLKNLYINFDYFSKVMKTPNYTMKDVLYDLLNAMSGACNSLWKFQIVERAHPNTGQLELQVVDLNFSGIIQHNEGIPTYQLRGTTSPFIDVDFNVSTPAAMQNSLLIKRNSNDRAAEVIRELGGIKLNLGVVFSHPDIKDNDGIFPIDMVGTIISGVKFEEPQSLAKQEGTSEGSTEKDADAIKKSNYEFFVGKAGVYPAVQNRNDMEGVVDAIAEGNIKDVFKVGAFNDSVLLAQVSNKDTKDKGWDDDDSPLKGVVNVPFGNSKVSFTVHGISGFKRGDTLRFEGLPKNFSYPHVYEVTGLEHEITTNGWMTKVETGMRPYGANTAAR